MRAFNKYIRQRQHVREQLAKCNCEQHQLPKHLHWQSYLCKRVEDLVEVSCCPKVFRPTLSCGVGTGKKSPKFLKWNCVNGNCDECSVEALLQMSTCKILFECNEVIDVLEWVLAERQGVTKGKQNTQLELGHSRLPVGAVVCRLIEALEKARKHQASYE